MAYLWSGRGGLEYRYCSYGESRLCFRGPRRALDQPYCAALGGTETFGKFLARPYPDLLEQQTGLRVVNFGCVNAGLDAYLRDETVLGAAREASFVILQLPGAHMLSNPFYTVHPRRNDRFVRASEALRALYPDVDFTEYSFTRHLLRGLMRRGPRRFVRVRAVLGATWSSRVQALVRGIRAPVAGLWMANHAPPEAPSLAEASGPLLVSRAMLEQLRPLFAGGLHEIVSPPRGPGDALEGMIFEAVQRDAARELPGPEAHAAAARLLAEPLRAQMG